MSRKFGRERQSDPLTSPLLGLCFALSVLFLLFLHVPEIQLQVEELQLPREITKKACVITTNLITNGKKNVT